MFSVFFFFLLSSKQTISALRTNFDSNWSKVLFPLREAVRKKEKYIYMRTVISRREKKSQQQIFQGAMATEHSKEFWWEQQAERLITRETICYSNYKSNTVWLHTHTHTSIVLYSVSGPLCKNTLPFCPLQSEDEWGRLEHPGVEMKGSVYVAVATRLV